MKKTLLVTTLITAFIIIAYQYYMSTVNTKTYGTIHGKVLLGPMCPVIREGATRCDDKPFSTTLVASIKNTDKIIKAFKSYANGVYSVTLPVGEYNILSQNSSEGMPRCFIKNTTSTVRVNSGSKQEITIYCDTGIR